MRFQELHPGKTKSQLRKEQLQEVKDRLKKQESTERENVLRKKCACSPEEQAILVEEGLPFTRGYRLFIPQGMLDRYAEMVDKPRTFEYNGSTFVDDVFEGPPVMGELLSPTWGNRRNIDGVPYRSFKRESFGGNGDVANRVYKRLSL